MTPGRVLDEAKDRAAYRERVGGEGFQRGKDHIVPAPTSVPRRLRQNGPGRNLNHPRIAPRHPEEMSKKASGAASCPQLTFYVSKRIMHAA